MPTRRCTSWCLLVMVLALAGGCGDATEPTAVVDLEGRWYLVLTDTAGCSGSSGPVLVDLTIHGTPIGQTAAHFWLDTTSRWSAASLPGGFAAGYLPLELPGSGAISLIMGEPMESSAPEARMFMEISRDRTVRGVVVDGPWGLPVFSADRCDLQLRVRRH